jgi:hypothetical protein
MRQAAFGADRRRLGVGNRRELQIPRRAKCKAVLRGKGAAFGDQEAVGGDTECRVVVEAAPPTPFVIAKAELLLEFLIIALDPPPQFRQIDEAIEGDIVGPRKPPNKDDPPDEKPPCEEPFCPVVLSVLLLLPERNLFGHGLA